MLARSLRASVLLFILLLLAACAGPTDLQAPPAEGPYEIEVRVDPQQFQAGQVSTFNYKFTDRSTGTLKLDLPHIWGKPVHLVLVDREMNWFQHSYADAPTGQWYPVEVRVDNPTHYTLWLEYADPQGNPAEPYRHTLSFGQGP